MVPSDRHALAQENLAETLKPEIIENIIAEGKNPKVYWGEFTHISYSRALTDID